MRVPEKVLKFLKAHRSERVLSVYIDGGESDPAERRHWRVVLRQGINREREALARATREERAAFERCVAAVEARVPAGDEMPGVPALACFCGATGELLSAPLPTRVDTSVAWRDAPRLLPFLAAHAAAPPSLVVMIDRHGASISRIVDGALQAAELFAPDALLEVGPHMGDAPRIGFHGGTRGETQTDAMQRQMREVRDRLVARVVHRLAAIADGGSFVAVGGAAEATARVMAELPPSLAGRAALVSELHKQAPAAAIPALVREALAPLIAGWQRQQVGELQRRAHTNGHAAFGVEALAVAAELGAIEELIVSAAVCQERAAEVEPMVQKALLDGASVEVATPAAAAALDEESGGIAAKLRFALAGMGAEGAAPRALVMHPPS
jgi:hypothetical protein